MRATRSREVAHDAGRAGERTLVDCGLFQGLRAVRRRNWQPFGVDPSSITDIVLTHAHLDHTGYLPALARDGFVGPAYATADTCALSELVFATAHACRRRTQRRRGTSSLET